MNIKYLKKITITSRVLEDFVRFSARFHSDFTRYSNFNNFSKFEARNFSDHLNESPESPLSYYSNIRGLSSDGGKRVWGWNLWKCENCLNWRIGGSKKSQKNRLYYKKTLFFIKYTWQCTTWPKFIILEVFLGLLQLFDSSMWFYYGVFSQFSLILHDFHST